MKYELPRQLRYETLARGPAARAYRDAEAIARAKPGNGLTGDGWMLRLISAGVTALACLALGRHAFIPAAWILTSIGVSIAAFATHCVGWALSVQIGARIEWGAICFVISTTQIRYEDSTAILPSIGFYLTQHVAQFLRLHFGVSLDFIWHGAYDATTSLLAVMLAVLQGSVIVEITRALTRRHATAIHANPELTERAAQAEAQAAALLRTEAIMRAVIGGSEDAVAVYDTDVRVLVWNPRMEVISGVRASMALGRSRSEVVESNPARMRAIESALAGTAAHVNNVAYTDRDSSCWKRSKRSTPALRCSMPAIT